MVLEVVIEPYVERKIQVPLVHVEIVKSALHLCLYFANVLLVLQAKEGVFTV